MEAINCFVFYIHFLLKTEFKFEVPEDKVAPHLPPPFKVYGPPEIS